jgi:hypothetical protein
MKAGLKLPAAFAAAPSNFLSQLSIAIVSGLHAFQSGHTPLKVARFAVSAFGLQYACNGAGLVWGDVGPRHCGDDSALRDRSGRVAPTCGLRFRGDRLGPTLRFAAQLFQYGVVRAVDAMCAECNPKEVTQRRLGPLRLGQLAHRHWIHPAGIDPTIGCRQSGQCRDNVVPYWFLKCAKGCNSYECNSRIRF